MRDEIILVNERKGHAMQEVVFLYVTFGLHEQAIQAIDMLIEQKLVACANLFPTERVFRQDGGIKQVGEVVVLFKTVHECAAKAVHFLQDLHEYDIPCISQANVEVTDSFGQWLIRECA